MCDYDSEILRLNEKIKQLLWRIDQSMSRSSRIETENKRLSVEVEEMKEACSRTSALNVKYKLQLEEEKNVKSDLIEGNEKLKKKVNDLSTRCYQQNEKIRMLESNLRRSTNASSRASRVPVKIIGSINEIMQNVEPTQTQPYLDLQKKYDELESQYQDALVIIDELEFELGDIDHLEMEIYRLQQENAQLREALNSTEYSEDLSNSAMAAPTQVDNAENMKPFAAMKIADDEEEEEHDDDFVNELRTIHKRKMMMQQKLQSMKAKRETEN